ncbi:MULTISPECIES: Dot/Icm T4SS effector AnkK/LegA5 [Legionella]|uniref:Ankyrin repeat domain-containing protein n=1 Tax=Legionella resiliens TaxID=2905958 RepID=A0ABS8X2W9_9GAMM|nr:MULTISPECIES: Dot/Icm T4SS effector AnkK/LegA5 [unclassified Legionella]MCE0722657.1 ankyrin repeat domain-containing protein [Legionella sp. 9fVS26]MCE3531810.1 ankyrin repeat domain-containing protein [Legionella sp. 8cVS16]QLZ67879.1 ankyrin repeat domain-containing protein [Legionella sp. PC1000]
MPSSFLQINDIELGPASHATGHETYLRAVYTPPDKRTPPYRIIYKKNKYGRAELSRLEVMFGQLARLFLLSNLTPLNNLVVDANGNIDGLAVEHLCYVITNKEGKDTLFYTFKDPETGCDYAPPARYVDPTQIPIYFMDKVPQGFYARLVEAEIDGRLTIDYESLASILATSYTLEEDDLHKGNYGFYLVEREGKPHVVFFKIDHDLMFVDSIMGFLTRRPFHLLHGAHAFDIIKDDLKSLVCLTNSSNSYWPTKFGYISNPFDNKECHNYADINAFSRLLHNPQFIRAKWKSFFKHILIPNELIVRTLEDCADMTKAQDRAEVALITQTTVARLARLRAALFSIKEFRTYVRELDPEQIQALLREIIPPNLTETLGQHLQESFSQYRDLCNGNGFEKGDTPLHTAIKLGEYRYEETISMFREFINVKNAAGKTPLDIALERVQSGSSDEHDVQKNGKLISKHLIKNGADTTKYPHLIPIIRAYTFKNPYLEGVNASMRYSSFKDILTQIGEDHRFCLKFKKNLARECIEQFIKVNAGRPDFTKRLERLRDDINGYSSEEESAGVKYIRQLRSSFWIIRQLRGLYGWSSTQWEIHTMINKALEERKVKEPSSFSFFSCGDEMENSIKSRADSCAMT